MATWLQTTTDSTGSSITSQSQRVRVMTAQGQWGHSLVLARGRGTSGSAVVWVRGEAGVAWADYSLNTIRVASKPVEQPWQRSTLAKGSKAGALRALDITAAGDLAVTWENWAPGKGYRLALALRPAGGDWSVPRLLYTDANNGAVGSVLARHGGSALRVGYGDDALQQLVARRACVESGG